MSEMSYVRHPRQRLEKPDREELLSAYFAWYGARAANDPVVVNSKIPREVYADVLNAVGTILLERARADARKAGPVREFLDENPLPDELADKLPDDFRAFCLALNALKQWVSAEQGATDKFLLGAKARDECRAAAGVCIVTGEQLEGGKIELHHPVRDGRPPIPLSKAGHAQIEGQSAENDPLHVQLADLRSAGNASWVMLRRGCLDHLGLEVEHSTANKKSSSRSFAKKAKKETGLGYDDLISWLDQEKLGL